MMSTPSALAIRPAGVYLSITHLAVRHQRRSPAPKVATVPSQTMLLYVAAALATAGVLVVYYLGTFRLRRRAAWELDRAEWRKWISRP